MNCLLTVEDYLLNQVGCAAEHRGLKIQERKTLYDRTKEKIMPTSGCT
jgi:hypothetical protein